MCVLDFMLHECEHHVFDVFGFIAIIFFSFCTCDLFFINNFLLILLQYDLITLYKSYY